MTQEEKQLLLIDLCARLPYGVRIYTKENGKDASFVLRISDLNYIFDQDRIDVMYDYDGWKPYLRSMSSMTEEEKKYISDKCGFSIAGPIRNECGLIMPVLAADWLIDFYNEHHIDYRGLIPMGLALEAPKDMYKNK